MVTSVRPMAGLQAGGRFSVRTCMVSSVASSCSCHPVSCRVNAKLQLSVLTRHVSSDGFIGHSLIQGRDVIRVCICAVPTQNMFVPRLSSLLERLLPLAAPCLAGVGAAPGGTTGCFPSRAEGGAAGACLGPTEGSGGLQRRAFPAARRLWQDDVVTRTATVSEPKPFTSVRAGRSHETPVVSRTRSPFCHSH